jgi:hypothetical protein
MSWIKWSLYHDALLAEERPADVATFLLLHTFSNAEKEIALSIGNTAAITGYSRRRVIQAIHWLAELNIITISSSSPGKVLRIITHLAPSGIVAEDPSPSWVCLDSSVYFLLPTLRGQSLRILLKICYAACTRVPVALDPQLLGVLFSLSTRSTRAAINKLIGSTLISAIPPLTAHTLLITPFPLMSSLPNYPSSVAPVLPRVSLAVNPPLPTPSGTCEPDRTAPSNDLSHVEAPADLIQQPSEVEK